MLIEICRISDLIGYVLHGSAGLCDLFHDFGAQVTPSTHVRGSKRINDIRSLSGHPSIYLNRPLAKFTDSLQSGSAEHLYHGELQLHECSCEGMFDLRP